MDYTKLFELEEKFIKKIAASKQNVLFSEQRERLEKFYHKLISGLNAVTNEMDGDYLALKELGMDKQTLSVLKNFRSNIIELAKAIVPENPYEGTLNLISWLNDRMNKSTMDNLNFIFKEFLKNNQVDFEPSSYLSPVRVESFNKLKHILKEADQFIATHPMLPDPRMQSTVPPPRLHNVKDEESITLGPGGVTVPGIPISKKDKEAV